MTAYRAHGRSARATVEHVYGLPRSARPDPVSSARDERLGATVHELAHSFPETSGVYVEDNGAANEVESLFGGGSRVDELLRGIGLTDTWMGGGYLRETEGRTPIPSQVDSKPSFGCCKYTTAFDLARLLSWLHLASGGRGPLIAAYGRTFTPSDARYLLYLLVHVPDRTKLGRYDQAPARRVATVQR